MIAPVFAATVTTLAGSGKPGITDGAAALASFVMPIGVAYDRRTKVIYVADAGAQRIRVVGPDGRIATLAGSGAFDERTIAVPPGYKDGPADQAQFDTPMAVAVDRRGRVYVADSGNHAVRKIEGGIVTTFARTTHPLGIAVDNAANVYVADPIDGLRQITPSGQAIDIAEPHGPFSVAVREDAAGRTLIVSDGDGVLVIGPRGERERYRAFSELSRGLSAATSRSELVHNVQGDKDIGVPYAIAVSGTNSFAYTDIRSSAVAIIDERFTRLQRLGGGYAESSMADGAGFLDGTSAHSRFNVPMGIAAIDASKFVVADSGNRRLRLIRNGFQRDAVYPPAGLLPDPPLSPRDYRVAFMGNSFIWYDNEWNDSIEGLIEEHLSSARLDARVKIVPIGGTHFISLAQAYMRATPGYYRMVVYSVNVDNACYACPLRGKATHRNADVWARRFATQLRNFKRYLDSQGVALLVVIHPGGEELSPIEPAQTSLLATDIEPDPFPLNKLRQAVVDSGVHFIDSTHQFEADFCSAQHAPLFGTEDVHFARRGREIVARVVADELRRMLRH